MSKVEVMEIMEVIEHHKNLIVKHHQQFQNIFHCLLQGFMNLITGFDIIDFDERVVKSGDKCMRDAILEKYGEEAVALIEALITIEKQPGTDTK